MGVAVSHDGKRVYVTNQSGGTVSVIDTDSSSGTYNQVIDTIAVGSGPIGVTVSPDGASLYVANQNSSTVSVIDINPSSVTYNQVVDTITLDGYYGDPDQRPFAVAVSSDGSRSRLYVTNNDVYDQRGMWVIDADPASIYYNNVIYTVSNDDRYVRPAGLAVTPVSADPAVPTRVYRANAARGTVTVIDTSPLQGPDASLSGPYAIAFSPADASGDVRYAYVTSNNSSHVSVIDTKTYAVVAEAEVGSDPTGVAVSKAGPRKGYAYAASYDDNTVAVIRPDFTVEKLIDVGSTPHGVVVSEDGAYVYVANTRDDSVSVIRTSDNTVIATVTSPDLREPYGVTIGGKFLYVTNSQNDDVAVIDINPVSGTVNTVVGTVLTSPQVDDPRSVGVWL